MVEIVIREKMTQRQMKELYPPLQIDVTCVDRLHPTHQLVGVHLASADKRPPFSQ